MRERLRLIRQWLADEICRQPSPDRLLNEVYRRLNDLFQASGPKLRRRTRWEQVDWHRANREIACELGVTRQAVHYQRARFAARRVA